MPLIKGYEPLPYSCYDTESWRDIQGYDGDYKVSCYGNVKSLKRGKEKLLNQSFDSDGYKVVAFYKNDVRTMFKVHRLVAEAFMSNVPNFPHVNHINGNKANNHASNLEFCSVRENTTHSFQRHNTSSTFTGVCFDKRKIAKPWAANISLNGKQKWLGYYPTEEQAGEAYKAALEENKLSNKYKK